MWELDPSFDCACCSTTGGIRVAGKRSASGAAASGRPVRGTAFGALQNVVDLLCWGDMSELAAVHEVKCNCNMCLVVPGLCGQSIGGGGCVQAHAVGAHLKLEFDVLLLQELKFDSRLTVLTTLVSERVACSKVGIWIAWLVSLVSNISVICHKLMLRQVQTGRTWPWSSCARRWCHVHAGVCRRLAPPLSCSAEVAKVKGRRRRVVCWRCLVVSLVHDDVLGGWGGASRCKIVTCFLCRQLSTAWFGPAFLRLVFCRGGVHCLLLFT
jgi:hypothetical protein